MFENKSGIICVKEKTADSFCDKNHSDVHLFFYGIHKKWGDEVMKENISGRHRLLAVILSSYHEKKLLNFLNFHKSPLPQIYLIWKTLNNLFVLVL